MIPPPHPHISHHFTSAPSTNAWSGFATRSPPPSPMSICLPLPPLTHIYLRRTWRARGCHAQSPWRAW